mgnify:CR=1 FL=1
MVNIPTLTLNDGHPLPVMGLGTYQIRGGAGHQQILAAIKSGYRLIDSATNYDNEGIVGEAIRQSGVPRSELFITSKLPGKYHGYDDALMAIQESLARMGLDYFDLFIIHWPLPKRDKYVEAWQALVTAQKLGLIRSIGVSNFEPEHLDRIIDATGVKPAVNQIEIHPYWVQTDNVQANIDRGITVEVRLVVVVAPCANQSFKQLLTSTARRQVKLSPVGISTAVLSQFCVQPTRFTNAIMRRSLISS